MMAGPTKNTKSQNEHSYLNYQHPCHLQSLLIQRSQIQAAVKWSLLQQSYYIAIARNFFSAHHSYDFRLQTLLFDCRRSEPSRTLSTIQTIVCSFGEFVVNESTCLTLQVNRATFDFTYFDMECRTWIKLVIFPCLFLCLLLFFCWIFKYFLFVIFMAICA